MVSVEAVLLWSPLYPQYRVGYLHLGCLVGNICGAEEVAQVIKDLLSKPKDQNSDSQGSQKKPDTEAW